MISRRFACLLLAGAMMLSSIWIVSADQLDTAAKLTAEYTAATELLAEDGCPEEPVVNGLSLAIDLGLLEEQESIELYQLPVQALQLQQEQEAAAREAAAQAAREGTVRTGRQALLRKYGGAKAEQTLRICRSPEQDADRLGTLPQGKVARLKGISEDGKWYRVAFGGVTGYVLAEGIQPVYYSDYEGTSAVKSTRQELVEYARSFLGTPYAWGGASPDGFDCSGFTMYVFRHFGYSLLHGASEQLYGNQRVSGEERQAGDLVFFSYGGGDISHVGIYLGNGAFIHATSSGGVQISWFDSFYSSTYVGAASVFSN